MAIAEAEVIIDAPVELVWRVMLDVGAYAEWNPFIVRVDHVRGPAAAPAVGGELDLHVVFASGQRVRSREQITRLDPPSAAAPGLFEYEFRGPLHALGLVRGRRQQILTALDAGRTRYHSTEHLYGLLAWAAPIGQVRDGFRRHADALKRRCESLRA